LAQRCREERAGDRQRDRGRREDRTAARPHCHGARECAGDAQKRAPRRDERSNTERRDRTRNGDRARAVPGRADRRAGCNAEQHADEMPELIGVPDRREWT